MENKKHKKIITILVLLILVIICGIYLLFHNNIIDIKKNETATLKYTETNTKIKEGIYITDVSEVVENAMPSIVSITSKTLVTSGKYGPSIFGNRYQEGAGSGIIISKTNEELMILTNNHVVEDADTLSVKFINDKSVDATVKGTSEEKDIAIISIKLDKLSKETLNEIKIATLGDSTKLKVGNGIIAIGNALGYGQSVTTGVVSALNREIKIDNYTNKMIQLDAAINGGNSGGALLNNKGEVVGINSAKYSTNSLSSSTSIEGMGFAIPISDVNDLINDLMNGKQTINEDNITLGVEGYIITEDMSKIYNMPEGFYVSKIVSGSSADQANLSIGNIITKINDKEVKSLDDIKEILKTKKSGDTITLTIKYISDREYLEKEIKVSL